MTNRRLTPLKSKIILLSFVLSILSVGASGFYQVTDCVSDDCAATGTRYGWPVMYKVQFSPQHDRLFNGLYPRWYRSTFVFGVSLPGLSIDMLFWFCVYLIILFLLAWSRKSFGS